MELLHRQAFFMKHFAMHEAALRSMKQSLTASFRHFFAKKMAGFFITTRYSEWLFELKT